MKICEGIVTTLNEDGSPNVSPMGPEVEESAMGVGGIIVLKPFQTSRTYQNLKHRRQGIFHVTDDVLLLARAAINHISESPAMTPAKFVEGSVLAEACRSMEFRVRTLDDTQERTRIECEIVHVERMRDFFGFNRAKHAVIEAAILATRIQFLPRDEILAEFSRLEIIVSKTAGQQETTAFFELKQFVDRA